MMWIAAAVCSAVFAGITAILSKCGVKNANSDVATAVRTTVVLVMAWGVAFIAGTVPSIGAISARSWIFLILSGLATGASWLCYYYAIQQGAGQRRRADRPSERSDHRFLFGRGAERKTVVKSVGRARPSHCGRRVHGGFHLNLPENRFAFRRQDLAESLFKRTLFSASFLSVT